MVRILLAFIIILQTLLTLKRLEALVDLSLHFHHIFYDNEAFAKIDEISLVD